MTEVSPEQVEESRVFRIRLRSMICLEYHSTN